MTPYQKFRHDEKAVNYVMLMATPLMREFRTHLDMRRFFLDTAYAEEILKLALSSTDIKLQKYSQHLTDLIFSEKK